MDSKTKRELIDKTRLTYGLLHILKDRIDILRIHANSYELIKFSNALHDTKDILQELTDVIAELEYILYLENTRN